MMGLITNLFNPKAFVWFSSVITPFMGKNTSMVQARTIVVRLSVLGFLWFSGLGLAFTHPALIRVYERSVPFLMKGLGALFMVFGLSFLWQGITALAG